MAHCPVCGMEVEQDGPQSSYSGSTFTFCSEQCKQDFERDPSRFVEQAQD